MITDPVRGVGAQSRVEARDKVGGNQILDIF